MSFLFSKLRSDSAGNRLGRLSCPRMLGALAVVCAAATMGIAIGEGHWILGLGALLVPLALFYPVQVGLGAFALLVPFDPLLVLGSGESGRTLTWFAGAAAATILLGTGLINQRLRRAPAAAIWWLVFVSWCVVTTAWAIEPEASIDVLPTVAATLGLYLVASCFRYTKAELRHILFLTMLGGCSAGMWTAYLFFTGTFYQEAATSTMRGSLVAGGRLYNPDLLGISLLLPIALALTDFLSHTGKIRKALLLLAITGSSLGLLVTMSRGAVVALIVTLSVCLYRIRPGRRVMLPLATFAILIAIMPPLFFTRFQTMGESGGAGRMDIWKVGITAFAHYGVMGAGLSNFPNAYTKYMGEAPHYKGDFRDAHNIFLAVGVETGVVGLLLLIGALVSQLRAAISLKRAYRIQTFLPATEAAMWGLIVSGMTANILWFKAFWLPLTLLTIATKAAADLADEVPKQTLSRTLAHDPRYHGGPLPSGTLTFDRI